MDLSSGRITRTRDTFANRKPHEERNTSVRNTIMDYAKRTGYDLGTIRRKRQHRELI